jgi:phosphoenolpyruvate synthase/pyruvate phosphate dikinase
MPVAEIGVPPGFVVDDDALERLVRGRHIAKYGRGPGTLIVYLAELRPGSPLAFEIPMRAKMPARVQTPTSVAYEYYQPESRSQVRPALLTVSGG